MKTVFLDANIFMYAAGAEHPNKEPCVQLLLRAAESMTASEEYISNTEVLQEILHRYRSIGRSDLSHRIFDFVVGIPIRFLPIQLDTMLEANDILKNQPALSTRDAVHIASMKQAGVRRVYSYDRGFDGIPFIERVEPK